MKDKELLEQLEEGLTPEEIEQSNKRVSFAIQMVKQKLEELQERASRAETLEDFRKYLDSQTEIYQRIYEENERKGNK